MFLRTVLYVIWCASNMLPTAAQNISQKMHNNKLIFQNVTAACGGFTNTLYKPLAASNNDNVATSPLSLHLLLSLVSNGAEGVTLNELISVLHHDDTVSLNNEFRELISLLNSIENLELHIANRAYIQDNFELEADFLSICTDVFQSSVSRVNFNNSVYAAQTINSWVREATNNKISELILSDNIDEDTRIVLLNAIYFKSKWRNSFNPEFTTKRTFHFSKTETGLVPTMFKKSMYRYGEISNWRTRFIEIPYTNQDFVMVILLPDENVELRDLENNFDWETLAKANGFNDDVELYLPKFKFEVTMKLKDILSKIGLSTMFENNANFTRLSTIPLKVSDVFQKVFIEVNEEGSEAAAASGVVIRLKRMALSTEQFIVDRPFMFMIQHKPSKLPLFMGSVRKLESSPERDEL